MGQKGTKKKKRKKQSGRLKSHFRFKCNWNKIFFFPGLAPFQLRYDVLRGGVQHGMNFKWLFVLLFRTTAMRIRGSNTIIMRKKANPVFVATAFIIFKSSLKYHYFTFHPCTRFIFAEKKHDSYHHLMNTYPIRRYSEKKNKNTLRWACVYASYSVVDVPRVQLSGRYRRAPKIIVQCVWKR